MSGYQELVDELIAIGVLETPAIIDAFRVIDRRDFVRGAEQADAYLDTALPIGSGQTISQPYTVAFMLELLQPRAGDNILDIGSGSGWQTALLAHIVSEGGTRPCLPREASKRRCGVTAIEIIPELCEWGRQNVAKHGFIEHGIVEMHCRSGLEGYPEWAPFDKIIAAAAGETVPEAWLAQTNVGGRVVAPVGSSILQLIKRSETAWERHEHPGFAFVPLVSDYDRRR